MSVVLAIDLNHPGSYVHWGFIQISVANLVVIGLMIVVFVAALLLPFPRGRTHGHTEDPTPSQPQGRTPGRVQGRAQGRTQ